MESKVDYKRKYLELRSKFISSLDVAYRLGYEQGTKESMVQQAQQQMAQAQQQQAMVAQQMAAAGQQQGAEGQPAQDQGAEDPSMQEQQMAAAGQPVGGGDEMDQYIAEIESLVNKSEPALAEELKKAIGNLKKGAKTVKPALSLGFNKNLPESQKMAVTKQEQIVKNLMTKWDEEANAATKNILDIVKTV